MRYYPVNLDVRNKDCLVVGGGPVGERKAKTLLACGARLFIVSPEVTQTLRDLAAAGKVEAAYRPYRPSDLEGKFLVIGATSDEDLNRQISQDAASQGILCNIVDRPESCSFVLPAIVRQGDLTIAISTSNKSPAFAKRLRRKLQKEFGPEYGQLLSLMGAVRKRLIAEKSTPETNKDKFERLLDTNLLELFRQDRLKDIDNKLKEIFGKEYNLQSLLS
jgi:precorrin-2 dehydrogenase/sirohydrochlorin ferrochelatase